MGVKIKAALPKDLRNGLARAEAVLEPEPAQVVVVVARMVVDSIRRPVHSDADQEYSLRITDVEMLTVSQQRRLSTC